MPARRPSADDLLVSWTIDSGRAAIELSRLREVPVEASAVLARKRMSMADVMDLRTGDVVQLDRLSSAPLELVIGGRTRAHGRLVVVDDETYALRILDVASEG
jgi:flagellar motor switch protein FliN/FliY